uniref:Antitoxin n=2 Tax=Mycobacterium riyadhense TaxID=486698 RepID=A0A653EZP9_9MYCO|nr:Phd_YefM [Mycobacterium riyadhense]
MGMEKIGIRELRQNASQVVEAAKNGIVYCVTNHGRETGVVIGKQPHFADRAEEERYGVTPEQIVKSGVYAQLRPAGYQEALLEIVERGRDQAGRIGER